MEGMIWCRFSTHFTQELQVALQVTYIREGFLKQGQEAFFLHGLNPAAQHLLCALQHAGVSFQPALYSCSFVDS